MSDAPEAARLTSVALADGSSVPFYLIPFDRSGVAIAPVARAALLAAAASADYSAIIVFSHGWNTDWEGATRLYRSFYRQVFDVAVEFPTASAQPFRPLLVGLFWPSVTMVAPWEQAPQMADTGAAALADFAAELAALLGAAGAEAAGLLGNGAGLGHEALVKLAALLAPLYQPGGADEQTLPAPDPDAIVALWRAVAALDTPLVFDESGFAVAPPSAPQIAGGFGSVLLSPRVILRVTSVWCMKDRAATVGASGVAPLLADLLAAAPDRPLHLVGHSFGSKVMLSALCAAPLPRPVDSALLLQPAVSCYFFADQVPGAGQPGGYRPALGQVRQPIWATYSARDEALARFHLALRRPEDRGEQEIAGATPDPFVALGYVGPQGVADGLAHFAVPRLGVAYPAYAPATRLVAVAAHQAITDHGDVTNPHAAWMLVQQLHR